MGQDAILRAGCQPALGTAGNFVVNPPKPLEVAENSQIGPLADARGSVAYMDQQLQHQTATVRERAFDLLSELSWLAPQQK